jgi:hypothetical protein
MKSAHSKEAPFAGSKRLEHVKFVAEFQQKTLRINYNIDNANQIPY